MKAAVLHQPKMPFVIEDVTIAKPGPREVLVRVAAVGVCHSDLHFADGILPLPLPGVLGHEAAGIVEEVGSEVRTVRPGDHVITCLSAYCGHCDYCLIGRLSLCSSTETSRGPDEAPRLLAISGKPMTQFVNLSAFAEQMLIHEHALVAIRRDMPLDRAALIGCGVVTGVGAAMHTAKVQPGETVAVIGCGGVGLAAINGALLAGAGRVIAIDRLPHKLELARRFGATDIIDASSSNPVEAVRELTRGGVHHAIEAIGLKQTVEQAFGMLRRGGTATVVGIVAPGVEICIKGLEMFEEKRLQGSRMGSNRFPVDIPRLVDFYMSGRLRLDEMISQRLPLAGINQAFDDLRRGDVARTVLVLEH